MIVKDIVVICWNVGYNVDGNINCEGVEIMKCSNHPEVDAQGACVYCGKLFCKDCLVEVNGKMYCKADISNVVNEAKEAGKATAAAAAPNVVINNSNVNTNTNVAGMAYPYKSKMVTLLLCIFLGYIGIHRFYVGKIGTGIIWFFTVGFFGIGWIIDLIMIIVGGFRDKAGYPLR